MDSSARHLLRQRKERLVPALALGILLLAGGIRLLGGGEVPLDTRPAQDSFGSLFHRILGTPLILRLGAPAKSSDPAPVESSWQEGTKPAFYNTSLVSKSSLEEILEHYKAACIDLGLQLSPPEEVPFGDPPDLYCEGDYRYASVDVTISADCWDGPCKVYLFVSEFY